MSFFQLFSSFTPDEWEAYSSENIAKAERERKASVALRSEINGILMQTYVDLRNIFETVNNEFSKRIEETVSAKRSLEKELARVTHCFVFYSLYFKAAQHSRRRKPGQTNTLPCYSFNRGHPTKLCTNGQMNNSELRNRFSTNYRFDQAGHNTDNDFRTILLFQHANNLVILETSSKSGNKTKEEKR